MGPVKDDPRGDRTSLVRASQMHSAEERNADHREIDVEANFGIGLLQFRRRELAVRISTALFIQMHKLAGSNLVPTLIFWLASLGRVLSLQPLPRVEASAHVVGHSKLGFGFSCLHLAYRSICLENWGRSIGAENRTLGEDTFWGKALHGQAFIALGGLQRLAGF